ncbi:MAG: VOC family protein [Acidobacteriota bacterium]
MKINPYLNFNGQCAEAFKFYEKVLGGKIVMMQTHGESEAKDQVPADWRDKVMHVHLVVGEEELMGSDAPPGHFQPAQGIQVSINVTAAAEGERLFAGLSEQGKVVMPFQKTFWSPGFGMLVDRFGTPWMVNTQPAA